MLKPNTVSFAAQPYSVSIFSAPVSEWVERHRRCTHIHKCVSVCLGVRLFSFNQFLKLVNCIYIDKLIQNATMKFCWVTRHLGNFFDGSQHIFTCFWYWVTTHFCTNFWCWVRAHITCILLGRHSILVKFVGPWHRISKAPNVLRPYIPVIYDQSLIRFCHWEWNSRFMTYFPRSVFSLYMIGCENNRIVIPDKDWYSRLGLVFSIRIGILDKDWYSR